MAYQLHNPFRLAPIALVASMAGLNAAETDDRIVAAARNSYNFKTYLKDDKVNIVSKAGAVTLTGKVQDEFRRALAEETLAGLPGVKSVNNQLSLVGEPSLVNPDATLRARVHASLLFHRRLSTARTKVLVESGVVTLQGEAGSEAQKNLATEFVKGLDGVAEVRNELTVVPEHRKRQEIRRKIDDASLTAQVKLALLFNKSTSAIHTKVHTGDGVVTLTGKAGSQTEKDLATRVVQTIEGVRKVRNQMSIEG